MLALVPWRSCLGSSCHCLILLFLLWFSVIIWIRITNHCLSAFNELECLTDDHIAKLERFILIDSYFEILARISYLIRIVSLPAWPWPDRHGAVPGAGRCKLLIDEIEVLIVWLYLNKAIFSLLRLSFSVHWSICLYLSPDQASINKMLSNSAQFALRGIVTIS